MMELSTRLQAVADFVTAGYKLADIGTDHAYIPIALVEQNRIPGAIAMDINEGPLQRAGEHIAENKMEKKIEIRLSNGFSALKKGEAESAGRRSDDPNPDGGRADRKKSERMYFAAPVGDRKGQKVSAGRRL